MPAAGRSAEGRARKKRQAFAGRRRGSPRPRAAPDWHDHRIARARSGGGRPSPKVRSPGTKPCHTLDERAASRACP
ncbi:hypothetical protein NS228_22360 [Methylobacterium indicum]|nr:hypothetical protein NS228_22360 [Methylobacterium indicum]KTS37436.1 hypothetical protein NS229_06835 [Methylobacterium indicum]KTS43663.1 hypothetical protein NS230_26690 [Methylobacterium indicum]